MHQLTEDNFLIYAAKHYDNPQCHSTEEFLEDLKRIKYIKKLLTLYKDTGELKDRLVLNHIIVLLNVFGPEPLNRILYLKMPHHFSSIIPFLILLGILPNRIFKVGGQESIDIAMIPIDAGVISRLRKI